MHTKQRSVPKNRWATFLSGVKQTKYYVCRASGMCVLPIERWRRLKILPFYWLYFIRTAMNRLSQIVQYDQISIQSAGKLSEKS